MKILMVTSAFDIGGAETHILELSKGLKMMGHEVNVASAGGLLVSSLTEAEIPHLTLPLTSKNPCKLLRAFLLLLSYVRKHEIEIVHAHARLPAMLCHAACHICGIPFVTTAHWVFSPHGLRRYFSFWGQRTLAVSADIKEYLIRTYSVYADHITETVNGIDTNRFSPSARKTDGFQLLHVSRLDKGRSKAALSLLETVPKLLSSIPNLRLTIVGGGDMEDTVRREAEKINAQFQRTVVSCHGRQENILPFLQEADAFVGVSRAALEAMSCGLPLILCGDEGYGGIFRREQLPMHQRGNFCCRGYAPCEPKLLCSDILALAELSPHEKKQMGKENRNVILSEYSIARMCRDALSVYHTVLPIRHSKRILICGYHGFGNMGDEASLTATLTELRAHDVTHITVLCAKRQRKIIKKEAKTIGRYHFIHLYKCLRHSDLLLMGGGNLIQDQTSRRSLAYYAFLIRLARLARCPISLFSCGIGALTHPRSIAIAQSMVETCQSVICRTPQDLRTVQELAPNLCAFWVPDIVFSMKIHSCAYLQIRYPWMTSKKYMILALKKDKALTYTQILFLRDFCLEHEILPVLVSFYPTEDQPYQDFLKEQLHGICLYDLTPQEAFFLISKAVCSLGNRLHLSVFSLMAHTSHLSLMQDVKSDAFFAYLRTKTELAPALSYFCQIKGSSLQDSLPKLLREEGTFLLEALHAAVQADEKNPYPFFSTP